MGAFGERNKVLREDGTLIDNRFDGKNTALGEEEGDAKFDGKNGRDAVAGADADADAGEDGMRLLWLWLFLRL